MINVDFKAMRLKVLNRQNQIEVTKCDGCSFVDPTKHFPRRCEGCPFYTELRGIGSELDRIIQLERVQREKKRMFSMDVKEYKDLIATGKTDREIIASHKTTAGNFYSWKRANGLVEQRIKRETAAKSEQLVASDLLREKREGKVITPSTATEDMITSLKKQLKQLNSDHLMAVAQHEKDMNELYGRLKQANAANAQLAFDAVNAQDELEKLRAEIGVLPGGKSSIKVLEEENALLRSEALSLRKQVQELSQLAAADTVDCDDNLVTELYAKIDLLNGQLTRQATNNNTANLITMIEEEEVFQTHLLRKLLAEREQRLALSAENKILTERVGLV